MSRGILGAIVFSGLWLAAPAGAQTQSKCLSSQLKASGAYAAAQASCEAKAAAKGEAVDPACLAKALEKAEKGLTKAEGKEDCIVTGAPSNSAVEARVDELVEDIVKILNPPPVICCQSSGLCLYTTDAAACAAGPLSGTPGAAGSVCTGDGTCAAPPAVAGGCCQDFSTGGVDFDCINGTFSGAECSGVGGTFSTAICTPSGLCL